MSEPIRKIGHWMPISTEQAMDYGLIPDTRSPVVISWRTRWRWRISDAIHGARRAVGFWIAGVDPEAFE